MKKTIKLTMEENLYLLANNLVTIEIDNVFIQIYYSSIYDKITLEYWNVLQQKFIHVESNKLFYIELYKGQSRCDNPVYQAINSYNDNLDNKGE